MEPWSLTPAGLCAVPDAHLDYVGSSGTPAGVSLNVKLPFSATPYHSAREYDIEKHWRDQKVIGLWMGGKGLKTLENARYWYDLETL